MFQALPNQAVKCQNGVYIYSLLMCVVCLLKDNNACQEQIQYRHRPKSCLSHP